MLLCGAYLLPGLIGRDPWRGAEFTAFGQMVAMAEGRTSWWAPTLGGVPGDTALLSHWLGAAFIAASADFVGPVLAARLPFTLLLALTLALVWYSTMNLARTDAAQPVPFAFGGEAHPVDYARAVADGAVLALMATLGLLQPGHETTPELAQLMAATLFLYGLAAAPFRRIRARLAVLVALPLLAGSGAPAVALALGLGGIVVCGNSRYSQVRVLVLWLVAACALAMVVAVSLHAWRLRAVGVSWLDVPAIARQWLWFMWPLWPLALWTLWRWRQQLSYRHISAPLVLVTVALATNLAMGGSDRALMMGLPGLAVLAAFALPTLKRSAAAGIDWFSIFFFSVSAITIWVIYSAMHLGVPAKTAANVARLLPGFEAQFSAPALILATLGSGAWLWLVRWRSGRHREALWKSLVLPSGGVALCWLLLMTLWLPALDYARSARPLVSRLSLHIAPGGCIAAPGLASSNVAALEFLGRWQVDARADAATASDCATLLRVVRNQALPLAPVGWVKVAEVRRPNERDEVFGVYWREAKATGAVGSEDASDGETRSRSAGKRRLKDEPLPGSL